MELEFKDLIKEKGCSFSDGLIINENDTYVYKFRGELKTIGHLQKEWIRDLNIMTRREKYTQNVKIIPYGGSISIYDIKSTLIIIAIMKSTIRNNGADKEIEYGDVLLFNGEETIYVDFGIYILLP